MNDSGEALCSMPEREPFSKGETPAHDLPVIELRGMAAHSLPSDGMRAQVSTESPHVAIIDSHCLTRECISNSILYLFDKLKISSFISVADCNNRKAPPFSLILLYLHGSEYPPLDLIRSLRSVHTHSVVFLISDLEYQTDPEFIRAAWRMGTRGFVSTKATSLSLALSAISFVQAGGFFFAPVDDMLALSPAPGEPPAEPVAASGLTSRETVVLSLLKEGKTNKVIARELRLSSNTVKVHVHNILRKMQASNRTEAASRVSPTISSATGNVMILS